MRGLSTGDMIGSARNSKELGLGVRVVLRFGGCSLRDKRQVERATRLRWNDRHHRRAG